jgi:hypothetical protein
MIGVQYREEKDEYALRKLMVQLQPIVEHTIKLVNPDNRKHHNLFLHLRAEKLLPVIISGYKGDESDLEHYVVKELRYEFEKLIREREEKRKYVFKF